ncbi:hypothetical protein MGSAQ_001216 [marine sediment metagenome]|uniref:Uncharacterized protein n=1 Tax=marine sediment metagenome TaxID=412755 RepID=A0A1B6NV99_9ZZZZ
MYADISDSKTNKSPAYSVLQCYAYLAVPQLRHDQYQRHRDPPSNNWRNVETLEREASQYLKA